MGYWTQDESGSSFAPDSDMWWGDQPADVMSDAIIRVRAAFEEDLGRLPTPEEVKAGLLFSLHGFEWDKEVTP